MESTDRFKIYTNAEVNVETLLKNQCQAQQEELASLHKRLHEASHNVNMQAMALQAALQCKSEWASPDDVIEVARQFVLFMREVDTDGEG